MAYFVFLSYTVGLLATLGLRLSYSVVLDGVDRLGATLRRLRRTNCRLAPHMLPLPCLSSFSSDAYLRLYSSPISTRTLCFLGHASVPFFFSRSSYPPCVGFVTLVYTCSHSQNATSLLDEQESGFGKTCLPISHSVPSGTATTNPPCMCPIGGRTPQSLEPATCV